MQTDLESFVPGTDGQDSSLLSLSFRDLPIAVQIASEYQLSTSSFLRSDSSFEFLSDHLSAAVDSPPELCYADDLFFCGKILPKTSPSPRVSSQANKATPLDHRRRSELVVDGIDRRRLLAAERQRLMQAASGSESKAQPSVQAAATRRTRRSRRRQASSMWYLFDTGSVKLPASMETTGTRRRQIRRRKSPPAVEAGECCCGGKKGWKLLMSLSCNGSTNSDVAGATAGLASSRTCGAEPKLGLMVDYEKLGMPLGKGIDI